MVGVIVENPGRDLLPNRFHYRQVGIRKQDGEFIAANPGNGRFGGRGIPDNRRGGLEEQVAGLMPQRIIDLLQAVEIQDHDGGGQQLLLIHCIQLLFEMNPIPQAGQRIVAAPLLQAVLTETQDFQRFHLLSSLQADVSQHVGEILQIFQ